MTRAKKAADLRGLESLALAQGGYFDRHDALSHAIRDELLQYHIRTGRFERLFPGVYRLTNAPGSPHDDLLLAWVWSNYRAAISHESALALYNLSDVLPSRVQMTVPPSFRRSSSPFEIHRSQLCDDEVQSFEGVNITVPARTIVDAAAAGTGPEQIQLAVRQALDRALTTPERLRRAANRVGYRFRRAVKPLIDRAIADAER